MFPRKQSNNNNINDKKKYIVGFMFFIFFMVIGMIAFYYFSIRDVVLKTYSEKAHGAVVLAAEFLDGDELLRYLDQGYIGDEFKAKDERLKEIKKVFGLKFLYVFKPTDNELVYIYAASNEGDSQYSTVKVGQTDPYIDGNNKIMTMMRTKTATSGLDFTNDPTYGWLASAYGPVFNSKGEAVLAVGADCNMDSIIAVVIASAIRAVIIIFVITTIIVLIYIVLFEYSLFIPLREFSYKFFAVKEPEEYINLGEDYQSEKKIKDLTESFNKMVIDLKTYISNLKEVTQTRGNRETEASIIANIQKTLLPKNFPPYDADDNFSLYATVEPTNDSAGDFYDFYMLDNDHLVVTIGAVSGKGIRTSLFMVETKTMLKNNALSGLTPCEVLNITNNQLNADNEENIIVTVFFGILEISTGKFTYSNSGHNNPFVYRCGIKFDYLPMSKSMALGVLKDVNYKQRELTLEVGDIVFAYTDGITEAVNNYNEIYSEAKLLLNLNRFIGNRPDAPLKMMIDHVSLLIAQHSQGVEQTEDIAMLAVRIDR